MEIKKARDIGLFWAVASQSRGMEPFVPGLFESIINFLSNIK